MTTDDAAFLLEAQREVDAVTPAVPPIAPPPPPLCKAVLGRHECVEVDGARHLYHRARSGVLWLNTKRFLYGTGPRPDGVRVHTDTQEFELPSGHRVSIAQVAQHGWKHVLEELARTV